MYYVYILTSTARPFHYVGLTHDLRRRIDEHFNGMTPVTKGYRPLMLVWYCVFEDKLRAAAFERYLKSGSGRAFSKKRLIP